jgi:hypothetical protein
MEDMNDEIHYPCLEMTASREWDPGNPNLTSGEEELRHSVKSSSNKERVPQYISDVSRDPVNVAAMETVRQKGTVTPKALAKKWYIGIETAKRTIENTTQRAVRDVSTIQGSQRLKHTHYQLKYRHLRSAVYADTLFAKVKTLRQNTCGQIFCTDSNGRDFSH